MAHMIMELDRGMVYGTTWHNMPQYRQLDRPITREEAREIMDFPMMKCQLSLNEKDGRVRPVRAYCIKRTDHDEIIVDSVGARYSLQDNTYLFDVVVEPMLRAFPKLEIESVGTLRNGATSFVNLKIDEFHVSRDQSATVSRLMYCNPLGWGKYRSCAHNVRIVCNNTLRAAEAEGAANETLLEVTHTSGAADRIASHMNRLVAIQQGFEEHRQFLEHLATQRVNMAYVQGFLEEFFPVDETVASKTAVTNAKNRRDDVLRIFESEDARNALNSIATTRYGLLQAAIEHVGTYSAGSRSDGARIEWDSLMGQRAKRKDEAVEILAKA